MKELREELSAARERMEEMAKEMEALRRGGGRGGVEG